MGEQQAATISAYVGEIKGGTCDGASIVVVAWMPTMDELSEIIQGNPIYLSGIGGLPPHFLTTDFQQAIRPV